VKEESKKPSYWLCQKKKKLKNQEKKERPQAVQTSENEI